jgi:hypothetical protein
MRISIIAARRRLVNPAGTTVPFGGAFHAPEVSDRRDFL